MAQPLLQFKERHRLFCVEKLRRNSRPRPVCGDVASNVGERNASLPTQRGNYGPVEIVLANCRVANQKEE